MGEGIALLPWCVRFCSLRVLLLPSPGLLPSARLASAMGPEQGAHQTQVPQLDPKWLRDPWRPVGAATGSRRLCPSLTRTYGTGFSSSSPPLLCFSSLSQNPRNLDFQPRCEIGFHFPTSALRSPHGEDAGWVAPWGFVLESVYLTGQGGDEFSSHLGKGIMFSTSLPDGNF